MRWLALALLLALILFLYWVWRTRKSSITGERSRNKHFQKLSEQLGFMFVSDDYFLQLEGSVHGSRAIVYPHPFEGPGLVTLIYFETAVPASEQNWVEPNLSLGRALVAWKSKVATDFELTGTMFNKPETMERIHALKSAYPYIAVTLPHRFSYSPLLQKSLETWKNYMIFLALDAGKRPTKEQVEKALQDAASLAATV